MPIRYLPHTRFARANRKFGGGFAPYSAEYQAVYDQFSVAPSDADANAQNVLWVQPLVDAGLWGTRLDRMIVLASHSLGADAVLDWIHPTGTSASLVNAPTGVQYQGYTSNGSSSYVNLLYNPTVDGVHYLQDSCCASIYSRDSGLNTGGQIDFGVFSGTHKLYMVKQFPVTNFRGICNNGTSVDGAVSDGAGMTTYGRNAIDTLDIIKDGISVATDNTATTGIPNADLFSLCVNNGGSPAAFSPFQQSLIYAGGGLTVAEHLIIRTAFQDLMTYYGTAV